MGAHGHADAVAVAALGCIFLCAFLLPLFPSEGVAPLHEAFFKMGIAHGAFVDGLQLIGLMNIFQAEFDGIHAQLLCHLVHMVFAADEPLAAAPAAEASVDRGVRVDHGALHPEIRDAVDLAALAAGGSRVGLRDGGVGAGIHQKTGVQPLDDAVLSHLALHLPVQVVLEHVVVHLFLTGVGEDDIGAEVLRRVSREGFHDGLLLAAEGAAHQGLYHPDLGIGHVQEVPQGAADAEGGLAAGPHGELLIAPVIAGSGGVGLHAETGHPAEVGRGFCDEVSLAGVIIADSHYRGMVNVSFFKELRCVFRHGLRHGDGGGIRLILDLYGVAGFRRVLLGVRDDGGHPLAHIADVGVKELLLEGHVLVGSDSSPVIGFVRRVEGVVDSLYAGHLLRLGGVHGEDSSVGDGAGLEPQMQGPLIDGVPAVFGSAGDFSERVVIGKPLADIGKFFFCRSVNCHGSLLTFL